LALIHSIDWKEQLPQNLLDSLHSTFRDLHRLSNYPFDAQTIKSKWHQAMIESELIRAEPGLLHGFQYPNPLIEIGSIPLNLHTISLTSIIFQIKASRELLEITLPLLFKELTNRISE
jgi:hypothetical protein